MHNIGNCSDLRNVGHAQHWHLRYQRVSFERPKSLEQDNKTYPSKNVFPKLWPFKILSLYGLKGSARLDLQLLIHPAFHFRSVPEKPAAYFDSKKMKKDQNSVS